MVRTPFLFSLARFSVIRPVSPASSSSFHGREVTWRRRRRRRRKRRKKSRKKSRKRSRKEEKEKEEEESRMGNL